MIWTTVKRLMLRISSDIMEPISIAIFLLHSVFKLKAAWSAYQNKLTGYDGGYYLQVAMSVRDDLGLMTYDSPFHHGIPAFPHPTPIYPLWPIILGFAGRLFDIHFLAHFLPAILSLLVIVFAYRFGREAVPAALRAIPESTALRMHAGHFLALLFMIQPGYLAATITPYSEGLSWLLLMVFLQRSIRLLERQTWAGGIEFGIWMGLLFLARAQFFLVVLAFVSWTLLQSLLVIIQKRTTLRGTLVFGILSLATFAAVIYPEIHSISRVSLDNPFWSYLRFDQFQATSWLPQLQPMWPTSGSAEWILDRLNGFRVAFSPAGPHSFFRSFSIAAATLPLACTLALSRLLRRNSSISETLRVITECRPLAFFILLAAAGWLSLHTLHKQLWTEWTFNTRQGMTVIFAMMLGWAMLIHSSAWLQAIAKGMLVLTFLLTLDRQDHSGIRLPKITKDISLLGRQVAMHAGESPLIVMPGVGKLLAPWSGQVGFHELVRGDGPGEIACLQKHLGAGNILLSPEQDKDPSVLSSYGLSKSSLVQDEVFTQSSGGWVLYQLPASVSKCPHEPAQLRAD